MGSFIMLQRLLFMISSVLLLLCDYTYMSFKGPYTQDSGCKVWGGCRQISCDAWVKGLEGEPHERGLWMLGWVWGLGICGVGLGSDISGFSD